MAVYATFLVYDRIENGDDDDRLKKRYKRQHAFP